MSKQLPERLVSVTVRLTVADLVAVSRAAVVVTSCGEPLFIWVERALAARLLAIGQALHAQATGRTDEPVTDCTQKPPGRGSGTECEVC